MKKKMQSEKRKAIEVEQMEPNLEVVYLDDRMSDFLDK